MKHLITEAEAMFILSMNKYWEEVYEREDRSPLRSELQRVTTYLGTRILWIVADYARKVLAEKDNVLLRPIVIP